MPFLSDADLEAALADASVPSEEPDAALAVYGEARIDGLRSALAILALLAVMGLFFMQRIPSVRPGSAPDARSP